MSRSAHRSVSALAILAGLSTAGGVGAAFGQDTSVETSAITPDAAATQPDDGATAALPPCEERLQRALQDLQATQRTVYVNTIKRAEWAWKAADMAALREILAESPEELRAWEWRWFQSQTDNSLITCVPKMGFGDVHYLDVDLSSNGELFVTAYRWGNAAIVHETWTGREIARLQCDGGSISFACFCPRDDRVLTVGRPGKCIIWNGRTGDQLLALVGHTGDVETAAFSPDGRQVATLSSDVRVSDETPKDNTLRIWDATAGTMLNKLDVRVAFEPSLCFSPDGKLVATESGLWDLASGTQLSSFSSHTLHVRSVCFSPDGALVLTASWDKTAKLWDATTGQELATLDGHAKCVEWAAFSADGSRLVTASWDKTAKVWNTATRECLLTLTGHEGEVACAAFARDGSRVVTTSWDGSAIIWDAQSGRRKATLYGHTNRVSVATFSPDGRMVVTGAHDGSVRLWDGTADADAELHRCHGTGVRGLAFSPDGSRLATASGDGRVRIWDTTTYERLATLHAHSGVVWSVAFSPDGRRMVTASWDGSARIWDADTGRELATLRGEGRWWFSASFSPEGSRVLTTSRGGPVQIWDVETGTEILSLKMKDAWTLAAAFDGPGDRVVTTCGSSLAIWDAATGAELVRIPGQSGWGGGWEGGHSDEITFVTFLPGGDRLLSAAEDGTIRTWDAHDGKELKKVRFKPARGLDWHIPVGMDFDEHLAIGYEMLPCPVTDRSCARLFSDNEVFDMVTGAKLCTLPSHSRAQLAVALDPAGERLAAGYFDGSLRIWEAGAYRERFQELASAQQAREPAEALVTTRWAKLGDWDRVAAEIRADDTITAAVRRQALNRVLQSSAAAFEQRWVAEARLGIIGRQLMGTEQAEWDAAVALSQAGSAHELALAQAAAHGDAAERNKAIWAVVRQPGLDKSLYAKALELAEAAGEAAPQDYGYLHTLALARYRMSRFAEAQEALQKVCEAPREQRPYDERWYALGGPISAMIFARLDRLTEARQNCLSARRYLYREQWEHDEELLGLLNEAEAIIFESGLDAVTGPRSCADRD